MVKVKIAFCHGQMFLPNGLGIFRYQLSAEWFGFPNCSRSGHPGQFGTKNSSCLPLCHVLWQHAHFCSVFLLTRWGFIIWDWVQPAASHQECCLMLKAVRIQSFPPPENGYRWGTCWALLSCNYKKDSFFKSQRRWGALNVTPVLSGVRTSPCTCWSLSIL